MKRFFLILLSLVVLAIDMQAQLVVRKSTATQWTEDAVIASLFQTKQSFCVKDNKTGELYGLNNKEVFGTEISLAVKVKGGYVITDKAISPWVYNAKFATYRDNYTPVMVASEYAEFGSAAKFDTLDIPQSKLNEVLKSSLYIVKSDIFSSKGLMIDDTEGTKKGWVVWVCADKNADMTKGIAPELICYSFDIESSKSKAVKMNAPNDKKILGGIYVVPTFREIGLVEFRLCGLLCEKDEHWSLVFPFVGWKYEKNIKSADCAEKEKVENCDSLTPVDDVYPANSKKRNKKSKK